MTFVEKATLAIAAYAAVVATCALFLELRRWIGERPKLLVTLIPDGLVIGGDRQYDEKDVIVVNVVNRGGKNTTITNLLILRNPYWHQHWLGRPRQSFIVTNPEIKGYPQSIPSDLGPNKKWVGLIRKRTDLLHDLHNGEFYAAVSASHSDRDTLKRIPKRHLPTTRRVEQLP
jgi:hypothetical protein